MSEPKYENPADFFSDFLGDLIAKNTQFEFMANEHRVLVERNERFKLELAKLRAVLEKCGCATSTVDDQHHGIELAIDHDIEMASSNRSTSIMDLNDDCLWEFCADLNLIDLSAVADVCSRFRAAARNYFRKSTEKNVNFSR